MEQRLVQEDHVVDVDANLAPNHGVHDLVLHLYAQPRHHQRDNCQHPGNCQSFPSIVLRYHRVTQPLRLAPRQNWVHLTHLHGVSSWLSVTSSYSCVLGHCLLQQHQLGSAILVLVLGAGCLDGLLPLGSLWCDAQECQVLQRAYQNDPRKFREDGRLRDHCDVRRVRIHELLPSHQTSALHHDCRQWRPWRKSWTTLWQGHGGHKLLNVERQVARRVHQHLARDVRWCYCWTRRWQHRWL